MMNENMKVRRSSDQQPVPKNLQPSFSCVLLFLYEIGQQQGLCLQDYYTICSTTHITAWVHLKLKYKNTFLCNLVKKMGRTGGLRFVNCRRHYANYSIKHFYFIISNI
uniref:Uncharacterized protein n=1 Tax=Glossina morsitans morsitans TaxID=37546 RepID=A0ABK9NG87_GLOMM